MVDLARDHDVLLPVTDPEELGEAMVAHDSTDLESYLKRFALTVSVMQTEAALERIAYELLLDAAEEGTRYMEVRFAPLLNTERGLSNAEVLDAALRGLRAAEADSPWEIRANLIVCALRNLPSVRSLEMARVAADFAGRGVVGFDLAGGESGNSAHRHVEAFDLARDAGLGITVHAGEAAGPESIRTALDLCHAMRIGHGTRLREDPELLAEIRDRQIPLEVCPTSNVQTRVVDTLADHPVGQYLEAGIPVTVSTDNRLISGVDLSTELLLTSAAQGWSWTDLAQVVRAGFEHAFLPEDDRTALLTAVDRELEALGD
jgi:adenosine deaminase